MPEIGKKEQEIMFSRLHKNFNSSKIRLINYKLIYNPLLTNLKFKNRYDNKCFMCKKEINEDKEHIFVKCDIAKKCLQYVEGNFLEIKGTSNSLVLLKFKCMMAEEDYNSLSCFVYVAWRVRNECKHGDDKVNSFDKTNSSQLSTGQYVQRGIKKGSFNFDAYYSKKLTIQKNMVKKFAKVAIY
jgi:hypothetical protein